MIQKNALLSIVSPIYMAENIVEELVKQIKHSISGITNDFEIILVNDGSPDNSWQAILEECKKDQRIKGISLSRNFGQHYAITAGLDYSTGDWVVVMDCDLQDQPKEIINLYNEALKGFDIVLAKRFMRKDKFLKKLFSSLFYIVLDYLTGFNQDRSVANFGIYKRKVINSVCQMRESIRYFPTMIHWVGYKTTKIEVEHNSRFEGTTSYNFSKLLRLAMDIILAHSDKPIRLLTKFGLFVSLLSLIIAFYNFLQWLSGDIIVLGYTSLIVSIWFLSGIIISTLGLIGLYVGKTFEGVKNRPIYIIDQIINNDREA